MDNGKYTLEDYRKLVVEQRDCLGDAMGETSNGELGLQMLKQYTELSKELMLIDTGAYGKP